MKAATALTQADSLQFPEDIALMTATSRIWEKIPSSGQPPNLTPKESGSVTLSAVSPMSIAPTMQKTSDSLSDVSKTNKLDKLYKLYKLI